jgi:predicted ATPase/DNA-binding SARP family transcriptional activator
MGVEPVLEIRLLGRFETRIGAQIVPSTVWRQRRAAAIVKLLALEPGHRLHREQLLDTLWPDFDPDSAANNLRGALHHARLGLERSGAPSGVFLARDGDQLVLGPQDRLEVDVDAFTEAASRAWHSADPAIAKRASELYGGDLLPEDPYEEWVAARREGLRSSYLTLLTRLAGLHEERGEHPYAIAAHERILQSDPLDEAAHAGLMRLHAQMGNPQLALAHYARLQSLLDRELGVPPEPATQALAAAIREGRIASAPAPSPPASTLQPQVSVAIAPGARLPVPVDVLVGREREVAELDRLLAVARLVTLTGPGGIGKTRLAQEAARTSSARFPDGVAFVDLAPLRDPSFVLPTVARSLGVEETGDRPIHELVVATIGERRLLLVLDNFEHLTAAAAELAVILANCTRMTVLATSRLRLRLRGEQEYPVLPLALPESTANRQQPTLSQLSQVAAIELFARRAVDARPGFALTDQNIDSVVAICRRLDGLPLAIELAAAQVRVLAPAQLLQRLGRLLDVLGTAAQDVPARQRTLRNAIAWSHDLLSQQEQALFRRLGIFAGGWSLDGAEAIASVTGDTSAIDTVETLAGLIDHSLVEARQGTDDAELRYSMLETIRQFAVEQLDASGEAMSVRTAFERFLIDLATRAEAGLRGAEQVYWLDRLEAEHDNFRAALGAALDSGNGDVALQIASRLWVFWWTRGFPAEGRSWLQRTLDIASDSDLAARASAEYGLGRHSIILGNYEAASQHLEVSLALRRTLGDASGQAATLNELALVAVNQGELGQARELGEEALQIASAADDLRGIGTALRNLGMVAREQGDYTRAAELYGDSLAMWRQLNDPRWIAIVASSLGITHRYEGNTTQALAMLGESQNLFSRLGDRYMLGVVAHNMGHLALSENQLDQALTHYLDALEHFKAVGAPEATVESIEWVAVALAGKRLAVPALRFLGAATAAREALELPPPTEADRRLVAAGQEHAIQEAGSGWQAPFAAGRTLTLDQARDEAIHLAIVALEMPGQPLTQ